MKNASPQITMISTLPPITGLSPYTKGLVAELSKIMKVNFLGFNHIYPPFLYPGKMYDETAEPLKEHKNLTIRNVLNWYNPFQWIIEALKIKTPIIHAQWWSYPLAPIYIVILGINKMRGKRIILTIHNVIPHEKNFLKVFLNKSVFFLGDEYIVHTQTNKEKLQQIVRKEKNIHVIPHGILTTPLKGITKKQARLLLKIPEDDKILLCFGHIRDYKGLDIAIKSLAQISDPKVKLLIAGQCWENWGKYQNLIEKFNLTSKIILMSRFIPSEEIESIFMASDLILLPYKHFDAQSGVGALVLSYEIPLIVSNTGGLSEYVGDKHCIFTPLAYKELAAKCTDILRNKTLHDKVIDDLKKIKCTLSWQAIVKKLKNFYLLKY